MSRYQGLQRALWISIRTGPQRDSRAEWTGVIYCRQPKMGLDWELPNVEPIRAPSQSLINKNVGLANGIPEVIVELVNSDNGEEMTIIRRGHKKPQKQMKVLK